MRASGRSLDSDDVRTVHPAAAGVRAGRDLRRRAARRRSRAGASTSPRPTRPSSSSSARSGAPSPRTAGASSRTGPRRPRSGRGCSTRGPRRSPRSPAFRDAFVRKRCLVPVDSFYEWKREGTVRQPYRVVRRDGRPLALAGLWAGWRDPATETVRRTFTIVTTTPNDALATSTTGCPSSSTRTPGIAGSTRSRRIRPSSSACSSRTRRSSSRSTRWSGFVNDVRRDGPELIEPLAVPAQPTAGPVRAPARAARPVSRPRRRSSRPTRATRGTPSPGSTPVVERGRERTDEVRERPVRVGVGRLEDDDIAGQAVRRRPARRRRRRPAAPRAQRAASATTATTSAVDGSARTTTAIVGQVAQAEVDVGRLEGRDADGGPVAASASRAPSRSSVAASRSSAAVPRAASGARRRAGARRGRRRRARGRGRRRRPSRRRRSCRPAGRPRPPRAAARATRDAVPAAARTPSTDAGRWATR